MHPPAISEDVPWRAARTATKEIPTLAMAPNSWSQREALFAKSALYKDKNVPFRCGTALGEAGGGAWTGSCLLMTLASSSSPPVLGIPHTKKARNIGRTLSTLFLYVVWPHGGRRSRCLFGRCC